MSHLILLLKTGMPNLLTLDLCSTRPILLTNQELVKAKAVIVLK